MRARTILAAISMLILWAAAGCGGRDNPAGGAPRGGAAVAVAVTPVEAADIREVKSFNGQVQPVQSSVLAPKVSGRVALVGVRIGDQVKKGDILVQLDTSEISAQVRSQEADLAMSRAKLEMARKNREYYQSMLDNYKSLYQAGAISKDKYDEMLLKYEQAMSGEFEAAVAKSEASLNYQSSLLEGSTVRAPFDGVVSFVNVEVGQNVTSSTQAVGVVDINTLKIKIFVGDQHINRLARGQKVEVEIPDVRNQPFEGTIGALSPSVDAAAKGYPVEVELPNTGGAIKQGMFARVKLALRESKNACVVPVDAVIMRPNGKFVFAVQNGKAKEIKVETGISENGKIELIAGGLKPGDPVVTLGHQNLVDGMAVRTGQEGKPGSPDQKQGGAGGAGSQAVGAAGEKGKEAPGGTGTQGGSGR